MIDVLKLPPEPIPVTNVPEGGFVAAPDDKSAMARLKRMTEYALKHYPALGKAMVEYQQLEAQVRGLTPTVELIAPLQRKAQEIAKLAVGAKLPPDLENCEPCSAKKG